jgi:predicted dienelactone hydrolase
MLRHDLLDRARRGLHHAAGLAALLLLAALAAAPSCASPAFEDPGAFDSEILDLHWHDAARDRTLPLRVRLPRSDAPVPIVLFSHGLGGSVDGGQFWGEHWASHGMAVVHLQHPGSDSAVWQGGDGVRRALREATRPQQLIARALDVRFVLDELARRRASTDPADGWTRRIDPDRIGVSGHSFGALTTQAVAGQSYRHREAVLADPRPRAFVAFSPSDRESGDRAFARIDRPFMVVTGSADGMVGFGLGVPPHERRRVFDRLPPGDKFLLWLTGADHMIFNGTARWPAAWNTRPPPEQDALHVRLVRATTLAFWRATLMDDAAARQWLRTLDPTLGGAGEFRMR